MFLTTFILLTEYEGGFLATQVCIYKKLITLIIKHTSDEKVSFLHEEKLEVGNWKSEWWKRKIKDALTKKQRQKSGKRLELTGTWDIPVPLYRKNLHYSLKTGQIQNQH